ncbi:Candidate extracytoplasmic binding receptor [Cupriavidus necator]|uniref:Candidate extracytoplasmic binding receptor n=1 Tax=Cupriavidus necator TaxID=106590 RepID=A0A1K0IBS6_CUPNE|nr:Candidate extracytoplasmic binding receptor [Cupriavidus necator]
MNRRQFSAALAAMPFASAIRPACAQDERPATIVVGFAAGGSVDAAARLVAEHLRRTTQRTYVVENRSGAAGRLAPEAVRRAAPDGATLMIVPHGPMTLFPHIYSNLRYDPLRDFTPVSRLATYDYALIAGPSFTARTAAQLQSWARQAGNAANFGSPGAGSVPHFVGTTLAGKLGVPLAHVPYRGAAPALADVMGGQLALVVAPVADAIQLHRQGKVRILGTSGPARSPVSPEIATFREIGIDYVLPGWYGLYGPAGMQPALVAGLEQAVIRALERPELQESFRKMGLVSAPANGRALQAAQASELAMWKPVVQASGFKPES